MRKQTRLLSSLLDLKLESSQSRTENVEEEGKRKGYKYCPIKVAAHEGQIYENFTTIQKKKSLVDKTLILKSLGSHFIFSSLIKEKAMQDLLLEKFRLCRVNKGDYLMKQSDNASSFFILHEGQLVVEIDEQPKRKIQSGEGFGELALLYSSPRSASIKANKSSFLWFIDRATFREAVSSMIQKNFDKTRKFVEKIPFFTYLTSTQKDKIASIAITQKFSKKTTVCKIGELASSMYIIKSGELLNLNEEGEKIGKFVEGDFFGEYTMLNKNVKWKETTVADQDCEVIALGVEDVENALGKSLPLIIIRNKAKQIFDRSGEFNKLSKHYIDQALDCLKIKNVAEGQKFEAQNLIFFVLEGEYEQLCGEKSKIVKSDDIKRLYGSITKKSCEEVVKFFKCGKIAWTTSEEILRTFNATFEEVVEKSMAIEKTKMKHKDYIAELRAECSKYSVNDFKVLTKLGEGQFGTVFLVTDPQKQKFYALKCISKAETVKNKLEKHLINEKIVLEEMNSHTSFCVNYVRSYKDERFIYFLMEYINGLDLFDVIRIIGILNADQSRFYTAIIISFLETMHGKNIIYRDLKPENIMVSEDGYLKLIDMGTCKKLENKTEGSNPMQKTFTIIGTPNYMAPQIISGKGYSYPVDLWSLGIVLYEFMAGYVPFGEEAEDPYEIYQEILKKSLVFPSYMKDTASNNFISQLLNKLPEARLGGSYSSLKRHPFLSSIEWSSLLQKKIKSAFNLPSNKLIEVDKFMNKLKTLESQLPEVAVNSANKQPVRKDLNPKWDSCF